MDVKAFLDQASAEDIARKLAELASQDNDDALRILVDYLLTKDYHTFHKHEIPRLACRALTQKGTKGIEVIKSAAKNAESHIYRTSIIESL